MSSTMSMPAATSARAGDAGPRDDDAGDRGRLDISRRAVERIVVAAAAEVGPAAAPVHRLLGQAVRGPDVEGRPTARVTVAGDLVTAELSMSTPWPSPVVDVADRVRQRVTERLASLAGMRVGHVDVIVTALSQGRPSRRVD